MEGSVGLFDADENGQSTSFHFHVCVGGEEAVMKAEFVLFCATVESYFNQETPCKA